MRITDNLSAVLYIQNVIDSTLFLLHVNNVTVNLDYGLECGKGYTQTCSEAEHIHDVIEICIGVKGLDKQGVNVNDIFAAIKTTHHELRHVQQECQHLVDMDDRAYKMALCYVARLAVPDYYKDKWNYYHCLKELDAEYYAVCEAKYVFDISWGELIANRQTLDYVNDIIAQKLAKSQPWYFIPLTQYQSISELFLAFSKAVEECDTVARNIGFLVDTIYSGIDKVPGGFRQDEFIVQRFLQDKPDLRVVLEQNTPALKYLCPDFCN